MKTTEKHLETRDKIVMGLKKSYSKLLEFKKQKNSELVVLKNGKIVRIKPD